MSRSTLPLVLAVLGCACTGGGGSSASSPGAQLAGLWLPDDGGVVLGASSAAGTVEFASFEPLEDGSAAGTLQLFGEHEESGIQTCERALYGMALDGLLMVSGDAFGGTEAFLAEVGEDGALTVTSEYEESERFEPTSDPLPESSICAEISEDARASYEIDVNSWAGMIYSGSALLLPTTVGAIPVYVDAGSVGAPIDFGSSYSFLLAGQGADAWGTCACGAVDRIQRTSPGGTAVDTVETEALGERTTIYAAAWDGTHLWLAGNSTTRDGSVLLQVDSNAEPDVLVSATSMGFLPNEMAWHQGGLYALASATVVRIDPTTGQATQTWKVPQDLQDVGWWGIASDGADLYLAGGATRVIRVSGI